MNSDLNQKQRPKAIPRWLPLCCIVGLIILAVVWMAADQTTGVIPKTASTSADKKIETKNPAPKWAPKLPVDLALQLSDAARKLRQIPETEKRIEYLYAQAPLLSADQARHLLNTAGADPASAVRLEALLVLENIPDQAFRMEFLTHMIQDFDPKVREHAFNAVSGLDVADRVTVLAKTLASDNTETATRAANNLAMYRTKPAFEALLQQAENLATSERSQLLLSALTKSIGHPFSSIPSARKWWDQNQVKYADDLGLISPP